MVSAPAPRRITGHAPASAATLAARRFALLGVCLVVLVLQMSDGTAALASPPVILLPPPPPPEDYSKASHKRVFNLKPIGVN